MCFKKNETSCNKKKILFQYSLTFIVFLLLESPKIASDKSESSCELDAALAALDEASGLITFFDFFDEVEAFDAVTLLLLDFFFFFFLGDDFGGSSSAAGEEIFGLYLLINSSKFLWHKCNYDYCLEM